MRNISVLILVVFLMLISSGYAMDKMSIIASRAGEVIIAGLRACFHPVGAQLDRINKVSAQQSNPRTDQFEKIVTLLTCGIGIISYTMLFPTVVYAMVKTIKNIIGRKKKPENPSAQEACAVIHEEDSCALQTSS